MRGPEEQYWDPRGTVLDGNEEEEEEGPLGGEECRISEEDFDTDLELEGTVICKEKAIRVYNPL